MSANGGLHEATAPKTRQFVAVFVELADAFETLGEDADQFVVAEQAHGVFG